MALTLTGVPKTSVSKLDKGAARSFKTMFPLIKLVAMTKLYNDSGKEVASTAPLLASWRFCLFLLVLSKGLSQDNVQSPFLILGD